MPTNETAPAVACGNGQAALRQGSGAVRVAISNSRLFSVDAAGVTFKYKDYRSEGPDRYKTMTLEPGEFIRRFLMHVLPTPTPASPHPRCAADADESP